MIENIFLISDGYQMFWQRVYLVSKFHALKGCLFQYSTHKAAAAAKSHSSMLYIRYNECSIVYTNTMPPPLFWKAQIEDNKLVMKYKL